MNILYTATVTSTGGRDGGVKSDDGLIDLQLALPKGLGGPGGKTNPEQLFAAGYAACFHSALKMLAGQQKLSIHDSRVVAEVGIGQKDGGFSLEVDLHVSLPGVGAETAESLIRAAHAVCPYSNATRNNIPVRLALVGADEKVHALA